MSSRTQELEMKPGNCMPIKMMPLGTMFHNMEIKPGKGGQIARSAGTSCTLIDKMGKQGCVLACLRACVLACFPYASRTCAPYIFFWFFLPVQCNAHARLCARPPCHRVSVARPPYNHFAHWRLSLNFFCALYFIL